MNGLRQAVDDFLSKQAEVYRADASRLKRDANAAARAASDHVGRWFRELLIGT